MCSDNILVMEIGVLLVVYTAQMQMSNSGNMAGRA